MLNGQLKRLQHPNSRQEVGSTLPRERSLAEVLRVGRTTLRQALDQLQGAGQIIRSVGGGSFVAEQRLAIDVTNLTGLNAQFLQWVDAASSHVSSARTFVAPLWFQRRSPSLNTEGSTRSSGYGSPPTPRSSSSTPTS